MQGGKEVFPEIQKRGVIMDVEEVGGSLLAGLRAEFYINL